LFWQRLPSLSRVGFGVERNPDVAGVAAVGKRTDFREKFFSEKRREERLQYIALKQTMYIICWKSICRRFYTTS